MPGPREAGVRQPDGALRYGPYRTRLLRCSTCHARLPERKGTPLFDNRLPPDTVAAALEHIAEGVGTRKNRLEGGTDRGRWSRKGRKRYEFSKAWDVHVAATRFSDFSDNFCWPVRTLRVNGADGGGGHEPRPWPPG